MFKRLLSLIVIICFFLTTLSPLPQAHADTILGLPVPGTLINLSPTYEPALIKGLTVHKDNPFLFDFIVDPGQSKISQEVLKEESDRMIKYFFASLTIPDKDIWVNLSPYEKDRMIPKNLGETAMGRDLLAEDYMLKQLTASLIYPQQVLGKKFWARVYSKAKEMYGTTQVPVNTFNKVWIVPQRVGVYEHGQTAFIVDGHLKVMLEEDYLALQKHGAALPLSVRNDSHSIGANIIRAIILPEIEKEINDDKNFATLRQIFYAQALAVWFKRNLKQALLNRVYANRGTVKGIDQNNPATNEAIYQQYLRAYKKGVFNYIKEDIDPVTQEILPRKYFSGGYAGVIKFNTAQLSNAAMANIQAKYIVETVFAATSQAMKSALSRSLANPSEAMTVYTGKVMPTEDALITVGGKAYPPGVIVLGDNPMNPLWFPKHVFVNVQAFSKEVISGVLDKVVLEEIQPTDSGAKIVADFRDTIAEPREGSFPPFETELAKIVAQDLPVKERGAFLLSVDQAYADFMDKRKEPGIPYNQKFEIWLAPYAGKLTSNHIKQLVSSFRLSENFLKTIDLIKEKFKLKTVELDIASGTLAEIIQAFLNRADVQRRFIEHGIEVRKVRAANLEYAVPALPQPIHTTAGTMQSQDDYENLIPGDLITFASSGKEVWGTFEFYDIRGIKLQENEDSYYKIKDIDPGSLEISKNSDVIGGKERPRKGDKVEFYLLGLHGNPEGLVKGVIVTGFHDGMLHIIYAKGNEDLTFIRSGSYFFDGIRRGSLKKMPDPDEEIAIQAAMTTQAAMKSELVGAAQMNGLVRVIETARNLNYKTQTISSWEDLPKDPVFIEAGRGNIHEGGEDLQAINTIFNKGLARLILLYSPSGERTSLVLYLAPSDIETAIKKLSRIKSGTEAIDFSIPGAVAKFFLDFQQFTGLQLEHLKVLPQKLGRTILQINWQGDQEWLSPEDVRPADLIDADLFRVKPVQPLEVGKLHDPAIDAFADTMFLVDKVHNLIKDKKPVRLEKIEDKEAIDAVMEIASSDFHLVAGDPKRKFRLLLERGTPYLSEALSGIVFKQNSEEGAVNFTPGNIVLALRATADFYGYFNKAKQLPDLRILTRDLLVFLKGEDERLARARARFGRLGGPRLVDNLYFNILPKLQRQSNQLANNEAMIGHEGVSEGELASPKIGQFWAEYFLPRIIRDAKNHRYVRSIATGLRQIHSTQEDFDYGRYQFLTGNWEELKKKMKKAPVAFMINQNGELLDIDGPVKSDDFFHINYFRDESIVVVKVPVTAAMKVERSSFVQGSTPGGIDLSQQDSAMRITRDANGGVKVDVEPALVARVLREGMTEIDPVIIGMRPADTQSLFGVKILNHTP